MIVASINSKIYLHFHDNCRIFCEGEWWSTTPRTRNCFKYLIDKRLELIELNLAFGYNLAFSHNGLVGRIGLIDHIELLKLISLIGLIGLIGLFGLIGHIGFDGHTGLVSLMASLVATSAMVLALSATLA